MLLLSPTISLIVQWKIYQKIENWIYGYSTVGHPFSQHFYCYYYLRNKDQYIKGGMAGGKLGKCKSSVIFIWGVFYQIDGYRVFGIIFIPLRIFFYLGWWNMLSQSTNEFIYFIYCNNNFLVTVFLRYQRPITYSLWFTPEYGKLS